MLRVDLKTLLQLTAAQNLVHELMGKKTLPGAVSRGPFFKHRLFDPPHRLHLWDACISHAIHVSAEELLLIPWRELSVVRYPLVVVMRNQVENILFEVGTCADNQVNLVATDHLG